MDSLSNAKTNDNSFQSMSNAAENAIDDVEISIFDAEKYFNEELNDMKRQVERKPEAASHHDQRLQAPALLSSPGREKTLGAATPWKASWNSQTALLTAAHHCTRKRWSVAKEWFLRRRNCCCSNGKSIRVKEVNTRPIVLMDAVKSSSRNSKTLHADADRRSHKHDDVVEIHRIRATEAPRQQRISATGSPFINASVGFTFPILTSAKDDDAGSDASSDLFEIETFSAETVSSSPIQCLCDSVDGDHSNGETKFTPANGVNNVHRSRLSVSANKCRPDGELEESVAALRPPREEVGGGEGRRKSDGGATPMSCRPAVPLRVGGRPLPAEKPRRGSSRSPPLVAAGARMRMRRRCFN